MDVAYYLSELLGQLGEVNVPGLGYFAQLRINGYYNNEEAVFYPPHHQLHFDAQFLDDDMLTQHIAEKKNISLASSKYFTEKYINNLKQEALTKEVPLADLGWLYFDQRICFRPAAVMADDPVFYGYTSVSISKLGSTSIYDQLGIVAPEPRPVIKPLLQPEAYVAPETLPSPPKDEPVSNPEVFSPQYGAGAPYVAQPAAYTPSPEVFTPQPEDEQEEFILRGKTYSGGDEDDESPKRNPLIWVGLFFGLLLIVTLGLLGLYKFKPSAYKKLLGQKPAPVILKLPVLKHDTAKKIIIAAPDTTKKSIAPVADTTANIGTTTAPIDTFSHIRYEISGGAYTTLRQANMAIKNYQRLGFQARILKNAPGKLYHLTLGTYFTKKQAVHVEDSMLNTRKVTTKTIGLQPYYPKTNP